VRAISLWQPWASAMAVLRPGTDRALKSVETRGWRPVPEMIGQRLAICAAKTQRDPETGAKLSDWWMEHVKRRQGYRACFEMAGFTDWESLPFGAVLCHGVLAGVHPTEKLVHEIDAIEKDWGNYAPGRYGWEQIAQPRRKPLAGASGSPSFFL
jgi:hypothetical protein